MNDDDKRGDHRSTAARSTRRPTGRRTRASARRSSESARGRPSTTTQRCSSDSLSARRAGNRRRDEFSTLRPVPKIESGSQDDADGMLRDAHLRHGGRLRTLFVFPRVLLQITLEVRGRHG